MILSPCEIATAAVLWAAGFDTSDIAQKLQVSPAAVHNSLPRVKEAVKALRSVQRARA